MIKAPFITLKLLISIAEINYANSCGLGSSFLMDFLNY